VRQWVLSAPRRLRYVLQHEPEAISAVLHIVLRVIEARLRQGSGCARGRLGAVSFVQRFGSTLNAHVHCCVIDGVFFADPDGQVEFAEAAALTAEHLAAVQQQVRRRVLRELPGEGPRLSGDRRQTDDCQPPTRSPSRHHHAMQRRPSWFARAGHLDAADASDMASCDHGGGFCLDASVRIEGAHRSGLERLLPLLPSPARRERGWGEGTALAHPSRWRRLEQTSDEQLVYRFPKSQPDGRTELRLSPLELIDAVTVTGSGLPFCLVDLTTSTHPHYFCAGNTPNCRNAVAKSQ
jgi:hypothetical protein